MHVPLGSRLVSSAVRLGTATQNAIEVARFGGLDTGEEPSPFHVAGRTPVYRLRHYFPDRGGEARPPIVLVPPLMLTAEVYDVAPKVSGVAALADLGLDPWVVDFGAPEKEEGGLQRTLADHVLAVSDAVERINAATGKPVHLGGYSQGGMFCYQTAAYRRNDGIASLITFGSPVDVHLLSPAGLPVAQLADLAATLADVVLSRTSVPPGLSRRVFQLLDPLKTARQRLQFLRQLHNRDALLEREGSRRFLEVDGWVAWPGPAVAEFANQFIAHNRMLSGGFVVDDRMLTLADIDVPLLAVVGAADEIASAPAVRAVRRAIPRADIWELTLQAGHMGLVVGHGARDNSWPVVAQFVRWQDGQDERPSQIEELTEDHPEDPEGAQPLEIAVNIATGAAQVIADTAVSTGRALRGLVDEAIDQLPRLARLQRVEADTRVSLSLLLEERAARHPDDTFFLFDGRGYSYAEVLHRIDAVAKGLLSLGVRQGEHVGVLMRTRPTAMALVAALSRIGAVAVMLRPDGELERELRLGQVSRVVADPEHAKAAMAAVTGQVLVLGIGEGQRTVPDGAVDMERIDADTVVPPGWYEPNAGRARDLALVLFTSSGASTKATRISNRRWALSAFGTASAASLGRGDTVYAVTPLHHQATLLTAIGGAVVSGARLAVAPRFAPETFWDEVRRYGVSVVSYTWTMVAELLRAEPTAAERYHPIKLFIGSGMPSGLWEQVIDRFRPARVLEFYAHTEGEVVLANLSRSKVGAKGRPVPGSAEVAVAAFDTATGSMPAGPDGFLRHADPGEPGLLLAAVERGREVGSGRLLRGLFERGDTWVSTGDLFSVDGDGDLWLLGTPSSLISTEDGVVAPIPVEQALERDDAVELAAVYGVTPPGEVHEITVAAVTVRPGRSLTAEGLLAALGEVDGGSWPTVVRLIERMPTTAHHRIQRRVLAAQGVPADADGWIWGFETAGYLPLTKARTGELSG